MPSKSLKCQWNAWNILKIDLLKVNKSKALKKIRPTPQYKPGSPRTESRA